MSELIGKTLDEIIDLQPDLDDLSWQGICYIVAYELGDIRPITKNPFRYTSKTGIDGYSTSDVEEWPAYHESWEHAGRVLESMPHTGRSITQVASSGVYCSCTVEFYDSERHEIRQISVKTDSGNYKVAITKAAAKCVLNGIELEVDHE